MPHQCKEAEADIKPVILQKSKKFVTRQDKQSFVVAKRCVGFFFCFEEKKIFTWAEKF